MSILSSAIRRLLPLLLSLGLVLCCAATRPASAYVAGDEYWSTLFSNSADLNGPIYAVARYENNVVVTGTFTSAGNVQLNHVALWDGTGWRPLGAGIPGGFPLAVYQGALQAGQWRWDGSGWTEAFSVDGPLSTLCVHGDLLVAGGDFDTAGGVAAHNLLAWDGATVVAVGGGCDQAVRDLVSHDGVLYVCGDFTAAGGLPVEHVASWDGLVWSDLGGGVSGDQFWCCNDYGGYDYPAQACAMTFVGDDLYVGGRFTLAGGDSIPDLACWDGSHWRAPEGLMLGGVTERYALEEWRYFPPRVAVLETDPSGAVVVGGVFSIPGQPEQYSLVRGDAEGWSVPGEGMGYSGVMQAPSVNALLAETTGLIVGGDFAEVGGAEVVNGASWDGDTWSPLVRESGLGTDGCVFTSLEYRDQQIFAGSFGAAGGVPAGNIAVFQGDGWRPLGTEGVGGSLASIRAMVEFGQDLVVAGRFETADGESAANVARWDGEAWHAMGAGLPCTEAAALCVHEGVLYAAGGGAVFPYHFATTESRLDENGYVYRWDGAAWTTIITTDEYLTGAVRALASYGGELIVAGSFTEANGQAMDGLLAWDGAACREVGGGVRHWARCLAVVGDDLYVGGGFYEVGELSVSYLARWDGIAWHAVGGGLAGGASNYGLYDLLYTGGRLYAGGRFDTAGGEAARNVAVFEDDAWRGLGGGAGPTVTTLARQGGALYVGGDIDEAGGLVVGGLSRWTGDPVPVAVSGFQGRRAGRDVILDWAFAAGASGGVFQVWRDDTDGIPTRLATVSGCDGPLCGYNDCGAPATALRYRLQWRLDDGTAVWLAEALVDAAAPPTAVRFTGAHPNPFNPRVTISFAVDAPQRLRVSVHDARGREVIRLADSRYEAGEHELVWDGRAADGRQAPTGVYFLHLRGDVERDTVKLSLLR